ncbi:YhfC family intramembrane metalloprotease [Candidatus Leptofilum sp.]|uniref:YhfC family intramembrane metalloprotease n=1 Tax=Candidatus Leptofilum sp. TaxID=3241576 RepID=UPI003B5C0C66
MIPLLLLINFLLMIGIPIWLGIWLSRKLKASWQLFAIGGAAFVLAQVGHLPFNWLILQQLEWVTADNLLLYVTFLGLSAGTFEGVMRYISFRFWAKKARSWGSGMMVGAGHGGVEAMILGVLGLINFIVLFGLREGYFAGILASVPEDQLYLVDEQIEALFGVPPAIAVFGALERFFAILLHLSASLLVMQVFVRKQLRWLGAGILWHALIDGVLVYVVITQGVIMAETVLGVMSGVSLVIIFWLRRPEPVEPVLGPLPALEPLRSIEMSQDSLDQSKYSG